jgi:hypothetical protein
MQRGSFKRHPIKKEVTPEKTQRGSHKRPPIKKEATQKNANELIEKTSNGKRGNLKTTRRGSHKRPLMKKEASPTYRSKARETFLVQATHNKLQEGS